MSRSASENDERVGAVSRAADDDRRPPAPSEPVSGDDAGSVAGDTPGGTDRTGDADLGGTADAETTDHDADGGSSTGEVDRDEDDRAGSADADADADDLAEPPGTSVRRFAARLSGRVRPPRTRWGRIGVAATMVVVVLAVAGALAWATLWRLPDDVAFRANGQDVTV